MRTKLVGGAITLSLVVSAWTVWIVAAPPSFARPAGSPDFNGDFYPDLAVGVPGEAVGAAPAAGTVKVMFGSSTGLTSGGSLSITQENFGGVSQSGDGFGSSIATGDFNDDGYDDIAIGAPGPAFLRVMVTPGMTSEKLFVPRL